MTATALDPMPEKLLALPQWVAWRYEIRDGKKTKVPINVNTGARASSTDATTWSTFDDVISRRNGNNGVGFVFNGSGIAGIDLDKCRDPKTGKIDAWALDVIREINSYTEISPSGTGVHIILFGRLPAGRNRKGQIEMYDIGRFFCMTGAHLDGTPSDIEERQTPLEALHKRVFSASQTARKTDNGRPAASLDLSDQEIIEKARSAANGAKFRALYDAGDFAGYGSHSEADSALCMMLAFYCGKDPAAVDRLFRQSALMRDKWDSRRGDSTYGADTIRHACACVAEVYQHQSAAAQPAQQEQDAATDPAANQTTGIVKKLADAILEVERFAQDQGNELYFYQDGLYRPRGKEFICRKVKALLEKWNQSKAWTINRGLETAEYIRLDAIRLWERPPLTVVNLRNGLYDVKAHQLLAHTPDFLSPVQLPIYHDAAATCKYWEDFITGIFPQDAQQVAWEILAWLMLPNISIQKAILLLGEGANGKSRFLKAVVNFLGRRNTTAISLHRLEDDKFAVSRLVGKLANICPDLPSEHLSSTSIFKMLVGGDVVAAERKYQDSFEFSPFCRLLFSANHPPRSSDSSSGFFRRWLVIPFDRVFSEDTNDYIPAEELDALLADPWELSGALNQALAVVEKVSAGQLSEPESMKHAADEFRTITDPMAVWLDSETMAGPDFIVTKATLLDAYNRSARASDRPSMTATAFGLALRRLRPGIKDAQRTIGGTLKHVWTGIGLTTIAEERV